jgi:hypothetical protein
VPTVLFVAKLIAAVVAPLQNTRLATVFIVAVGFTVMVKALAVPRQLTSPLVKVGLTLMVATTGAVPLFTALKAAILPVPDAASPIEAALLVQLYVTTPPLAVLAKFTAAVVAPLHTTWLPTALTAAVGFTVIVKVLETPVQLTVPAVKMGVTVMVAVIGAVVVLLAVKAAILPVPEAANPMASLSLIQL